MTRKEFKKYCEAGFLVLDGATGTELLKRGMPGGVCPELWVFEHPEVICDIHDSYISAGSNIVYAPTFGGNRCKLAEFGLAPRTAEIVSSLASVTVKNASGRAWVFGDIAPTGRFVEPFGDLPFEEAVAIFKESAAALAAGGVDGFVIETMMDLQEARAALIGVREAAPELPVIVTMTFDASRRTLTGNTPEAALIALQSLGADAFGCNCSTGPEEMAGIIASMRPYAKIPLVAKPNAGLPRLVDGRTVFSMSPEQFSGCAGTLISAGASLLGGCCGTTPEHIAALYRQVKKCIRPEKSPVISAVVSSASGIRQIGGKFTVIGERINPTGKKAFQAQLREGVLDMVSDFAIQQSNAGAHILDVNMGLSGINEAQMMRRATALLAKSTSLPLCIDSTDPEAVEAALRLYPGRALFNSISAEKDRLEKILPIAARYGAMLVILPLTDTGIPATAAGRMEVVDKIIAAAANYGYDTADICVDALIMAVASEPQAAKTALELISLCSSRQLNTVCGLSNVSFGLPDRALLNRTFLGMAMGRGLSAAIANPLFPELMAMVYAGDALYERDDNMSAYLAAADGNSGMPVQSLSLSPADAVKEAVLRGESGRVVEMVKTALQSGITPQDMLNTVLIPAVKEVGKRYEQKTFFLPQLIAGAEAMSAASAYLEPMLNSGDAAAEAKPKFIIATVKGDIHDIGKNIVAAVLRNYGFEVIDLGKDVPAEVILDTAEKEGVSLIGLSALMTTTMGAMREVTLLAGQRKLDHLHFIVGGAVVDKEFADSIGAVYAADPMDAVNAANSFLH